MQHPLLRRLRGAHDDEKGFTLIELLVVILIIGILAAIALPTFLGQQKKAQDASAKSNVRNAVTQIESCLAEATTTTDADCGDRTKNPGLAALGTSITMTTPAEILADGTITYAVRATSKSSNWFAITRTAGAAPVYSSNPADAKWNAS